MIGLMLWSYTLAGTGIGNGIVLEIYFMTNLSLDLFLDILIGTSIGMTPMEMTKFHES